MCQLATFIFSNMGAPTNLLLQVPKDGVLDHRSSDPSVIGTCRLKIALVSAWKSSGPYPRPFTF